jgi:hypothetical protein
MAAQTREEIWLFLAALVATAESVRPYHTSRDNCVTGEQQDAIEAGSNLMVEAHLGNKT